MRGRLSVAFYGEEGIDAGGLTREWFIVLARSIFNPNYALFIDSADAPTYQVQRNERDERSREIIRQPADTARHARD